MALSCAMPCRLPSHPANRRRCCLLELEISGMRRCSPRLPPCPCNQCRLADNNLSPPPLPSSTALPPYLSPTSATPPPHHPQPATPCPRRAAAATTSGDARPDFDCSATSARKRVKPMSCPAVKQRPASPRPPVPHARHPAASCSTRCGAARRIAAAAAAATAACCGWVAARCRLPLASAG